MLPQPPAVRREGAGAARARRGLLYAQSQDGPTGPLPGVSPELPEEQLRNDLEELKAEVGG